MTRCKFCRAHIEWVVTPKGRRMPLDPGPVYIRQTGTPSGDLVSVVTGDGEIEAGWRTDHVSADQVGRISHFATCPHAAAARKRSTP